MAHYNISSLCDGNTLKYAVIKMPLKPLFSIGNKDTFMLVVRVLIVIVKTEPLGFSIDLCGNLWQSEM